MRRRTRRCSAISSSSNGDLGGLGVKKKSNLTTNLAIFDDECGDFEGLCDHEYGDFAEIAENDQYH